MRNVAQALQHRQGRQGWESIGEVAWYFHLGNIVFLRVLPKRMLLNESMNFSLEHIGLASKDPTKLCSWYKLTLGATVVHDNRQNPPAYLLALPGGALLEIYPASHHVPETGYNRLGGWRHLALRVESIEAAQACLEQRGVVFSDPIRPAGGGGRVLFFADADGNLLHLVERPPNWVPTP